MSADSRGFNNILTNMDIRNPQMAERKTVSRYILVAIFFLGCCYSSSHMPVPTSHASCYGSSQTKTPNVLGCLGISILLPHEICSHGSSKI
jgi:hypothetical protein